MMGFVVKLMVNEGKDDAYILHGWLLKDNGLVSLKLTGVRIAKAQ